MKIKYIYRRWKRETFSPVVPNLGPWFNPKASQPLVQSSNEELSVLCRKMAGRVGHFGWCHRLSNLNQPERITLACIQVSGDRFRVCFVKFGKETKL
jgi:hypothetical protein